MVVFDRELCLNSKRGFLYLNIPKKLYGELQPNVKYRISVEVIPVEVVASV